jgi:Ni/Fe-hydrogenase 1 B-type cytochrome subunit
MSAPAAVERSQRPAAAPRTVFSEPLVRVYVWELPVRLSHWLIVGSIFTLAFTGFYIGRPFLVVPGEARFRFVMGTIKAIHLYAAIVFTAAVVMRVFWMFAGNRWASWREFVPTTRARLRLLVRMLRFYTFLGPEPRDVIIGHNPLAGVAYLGVFGLYVLAIVTGVALYAATSAVGSPLHGLAFLAPWLGGLQTVRFVHHLTMWLLLGFFAHHVFSALLFSLLKGSGTMESIFSGYKFERSEQVERNDRDRRSDRA